MAASAMWNKKNAYGYECYMSEWIPDRASDTENLTGIQYTIYEMEHVLRDLRVYPFEYFIWYTGWGVSTSTDDSRSKLLAWNLDSVNGELGKTKLYYIFQKLWGEVPYDGSYRVQYLTSSDSDIKTGSANVTIDALAFEGDNKTVVVIINPSETAKTFTFSGLSDYTTGELFRTTSDQDMVSDGTVSISDGIASISLPAESINFLIASETVVQDALSFDTVPLTLTAGETYTVTVDYSSVENRIIQTKLYTGSWETVCSKTETVNSGSGVLTYNITIPAGTAPGTSYIWYTKMYSTNWSTSYASDIRYNVVVSEGPSVPQNLSATAVSSSQIDLTWDASSGNVYGYNILRNNMEWIDVSTITSYSDTGLSPDTTYTYNVAAFDEADNTSANSATASATTQVTVPSVDAISFATVPLALIAGETYTVTVDYSAVGDRLIQTKLCNSSWENVCSKIETVNSGSGVLTYNITIPAGTAPGTSYIWYTKMYSTNWSTSYASEICYNVVVSESVPEDALLFNIVPLTLTAGETYTVTVDYSAVGDRIIQTKLCNGSWENVCSKTETVNSGSGELTCNITIPAGTAPGTSYIWYTKMYSTNWSTSYASEIRYNVVVSEP
ncbi:MAG: fibronectin type III domain-containing protein [Kiritimatiellae bacterium]|jgi:hypothetical protein|nr:fibronectin type III domain-containing protein [Kiritimatiellia bacterium]